MLSEKKLRHRLLSRGFRDLKQFARMHRLNRNTIHAYLRGGSVFSRQFMRIAESLECDPFDLLVAREDIPDAAGISSEIAPLVHALTAGFTDICVVLFGSRAGSGRPREYSDWDLGVCRARGTLKTGDFLLLKGRADELSDSLPRRVDLVNLDRAPPWFVKAMKQRPRYLGGNRLAWYRFMETWGAYHGKSETSRVD